MNYFNGRFDVEDGGYHDETHYRIVGGFVDNSGTYFATDAKVGDIIYLDGSPIGVPLLRYKIAEVKYGRGNRTSRAIWRYGRNNRSITF